MRRWRYVSRPLLGTGLWAGLLFVVLLVVLALSVAGYFSGLRDSERAAVAQEVSLRGSVLSHVVDGRTSLLEGLREFALRELPGEPDQRSFEQVAEELASRASGVRALQLAPGAMIEYVYPVEGNEASVGHDLLTDERAEVREDVRAAIDSDVAVSSGPYELRQGGLGLVSRMAIRDADGDFWGLAIVVLDLPEVLAVAELGDSADTRMALAHEGGEVFWGDAGVMDSEPEVFPVDLHGESWILAGVPRDGWSGAFSPGTRIIWLLGLATIVLSSILVHVVVTRQGLLASEITNATSALSEANEELESRLASEEEAIEELSRSEDRFRQLWEHAPLPMATARRGLTVMANGAYADLMGYESPDEMVGTSLIERIAESDRERVAGYAASREEGRDAPVAYETVVLRKDGAELPVMVRTTRVALAEGDVTAAFFTDLSPRMEFERLLREREAVFHALFENSPVALFEENRVGAKQAIEELGLEPDELDRRLQDEPDELTRLVGGMEVVRANIAAQELSEVGERGQLQGELGRTVTEENRDLFRRQLVAMASGDKAFSGTGALVTSGGLVRNVTVYWVVAPDSGTTYERVFVSIIDVSELVKVQTELEGYRATLEEQVEERTRELSEALEGLKDATESKDRFLASMSHELRTPLNSIIGFSGTMLQGLAGDLSEEQERQLGWISRSGKHLLTLINQILDLAKIESGRIEVVVSDVDASRAAEEAVQEISALADDKGLEITVDRGSDPVVFRTDPDRLHQVLLNLLANAVKFTPEGEVALSVRQDALDARFEVRDTGGGIEPLDREHIFDPFYQGDDERGAKTSGTGLGLAISREIAQLLGGSLSLESTSETGSVFSLRLPLDGPPDSAPDPDES